MWKCSSPSVFILSELASIVSHYNLSFPKKINKLCRNYLEWNFFFLAEKIRISQEQLAMRVLILTLELVSELLTLGFINCKIQLIETLPLDKALPICILFGCRAKQKGWSWVSRLCANVFSQGKVWCMSCIHSNTFIFNQVKGLNSVFYYLLFQPSLARFESRD